ncbi:hypothetical protein B0H13DRAFT_1998694 [Mycena leptocephala]|nr:hypothetical protein B0H13DRAFT_1998694 [Mycena leptocephala]
MTDSTDPPPSYAVQNLSVTTNDKDATSPPPEPRYIYYRVYTRDGAIPSKTAVDPRSPFMGRVIARSVPPPHTVASLKRRLVSAENISDPVGLRTVLYLNAVAQAPMNDTTKVKIVGPSPDISGATPETAFALALVEELTVEEVAKVSVMLSTAETREDPRYLYYHLYTQSGEDTSRVSFNPHDPALGRIERFRIPPPLGPASIKRCIAKVEAIPYMQRPICDAGCSFYAALQDGTAGSTEERRMAVVQAQPSKFNIRFERVGRTLPSTGLRTRIAAPLTHAEGGEYREGGSWEYVIECLMSDGARGYVRLCNP